MSAVKSFAVIAISRNAFPLVCFRESEGVPLSAVRALRDLFGFDRRSFLATSCIGLAGLACVGVCLWEPWSLELGLGTEVSGRALPGVAGPAGQVKVQFLVKAAFGHGILVVNVHRPVVPVRPGGDPKGFISVDEAGIEAAAVTGAVMQTGSEKPEQVMVTVDRPFVFLIRDPGTGTILFLGRVVEP